MNKTFATLAFALLLLVPGLAATTDQTDVMLPIHQFVDGFNKGDTASALAACADQAIIMDEFPPYQWSGAGACSAWAKAYETFAKQEGSTGGMVTLGKPRSVDVVGDRAYVVVPAGFTWKQKGKPMKETGASMTFALQKTAAGWRITAWTWTKA